MSNILSENTEIINNHRGRWAEGTCDEEPLNMDIMDFLLKEGYASFNISSWHDDMQGFWRWYADIHPANDI